MLVLGLQGSPRKNGNTHALLSAFMEEAARFGANTQTIEVDKKHILPCKELIVCEKKGFCPLDDDMKHEIYALLRKAEVIVPATPIFFYNTTAQLKLLIDRTQTLWARKYKLELTDPARHLRKGFTLAVGATKGKNLFEGLHLTMKYFYDAVGAVDSGSLTYRHIEHMGDMEQHPTYREDVRSAVQALLTPLVNRRKIVFVCRDNACASQMAAAFAMKTAGDRLDVECAGLSPDNRVDPVMIEAMAERGIDMAFRRTQRLADLLPIHPPEIITTIGCAPDMPVPPEAKHIDWDLPGTSAGTIDQTRELRDEIERRVEAMAADSSIV